MQPIDLTLNIQEKPQIPVSTPKVSSKVVSWEGRIVGCALCGTATSNYIAAGYLLVGGGMIIGNLYVSEIAKGAVIVGGFMAVSGTISLLLKKGMNRFMSEKKLEDNVIELDKIVEKETAEIELLKKEKEELRILVDELKNEMLKSENIVAELKTALEAKVKDFSELEIRFKQDALTLGKIDVTIHDQENVIQRIDEENKELKKTYGVIKKENDRLTKEVQDIRIQMSSYNSENEEFKTERKSFENEKNELIASIKLLGSELEEVKKNYDEAQKERLEVLQKAGSLNELCVKLESATENLKQTELNEQKILVSINEKVKSMGSLEDFGNDLKPLLDALKNNK